MFHKSKLWHLYYKYRHSSNRPPQHFQFCLLWISFYSQYSADAQSMPACARCNLPFAWLWQPTASQACVWAHSTAQYAYLHGNLDKQNAQWNVLSISIFASSLLPAPLSLCEQTKPQETWRRQFASNKSIFQSASETSSPQAFYNAEYNGVSVL